MAHYPSYKSIDLPWVKSIPTHWDIQRNKNIFTEKKDEVGENSSEYTLLSLTTKGIIPRDVESGKGKFPASFDKYKVIKPGYIAFCLFDIDETPRTVGLSELDGMLTGAYTVFETRGINPKYAFYYYLALDNEKALKPLYTGLRKTIKTDTFLRTKMPVPPINEQDAIVNYLDWKTSKINKLISSKRKQISLILEQRKTLINDVITRGLKQDAPLKDSGVFWLGDIPESWSAIKIKYLFSEDNDRNIDGSAELLSFSKKKGLVPFSEISAKAPSASDLSNYRIVHEGQLLENRMQAWNGMFIRVNRSGCVSPDYSVFNASADRYVNVKFYEYVFRSPLQVEQFANASRGLGTGFNRLYTPAFGAIYTIYPPQIEQDAIVKYLDNLAQKFDVMIQKKEEQIERLKELKTLLISDAVFGKVNVTGVHVPEYEYLTEELDSDFDDDIEETEEQED